MFVEIPVMRSSVSHPVHNSPRKQPMRLTEERGYGRGVAFVGLVFPPPRVTCRSDYPICLHFETFSAIRLRDVLHQQHSCKSVLA